MAVHVSLSPLYNKKLMLLYSILLSIAVTLTTVWYFKPAIRYTVTQSDYPEPPWYRIISGLSGATTGFKVEMPPFRRYNGELKLKEYPKNTKRTGLLTEKCTRLTKWAVITTIAHEATKTMNVFLENSREFCLLVVGDRKSPDAYKLKAHADRFIYLTIDKQNSLPLEIVSLTPENSFSRKNIGFMFAIANGAKIILDLDDDNIPIKQNSTYFPIIETTGTFSSPIVNVQKEGPVWNPYPYYGAPNAWPRGFPLDKIMPLNRKLQTKHRKCLPIIQQYMANRDPDVDAMYRLSHPLPMNYATNKEPMVLPQGVFCPYNAQATLHLYEAFWSMLLPKTVNGRVSDIWRSYISKYVMSSIPGTCIMFAPPAVRHDRNSHNYLRDFYSELPLYLLASQLVDRLSTHPPQSGPLQGVLLNTYVTLYEMGVLEEEDVQYIIAWINDLNNIDYQFPLL